MENDKLKYGDKILYMEGVIVEVRSEERRVGKEC